MRGRTWLAALMLLVSAGSAAAQEESARRVEERGSRSLLLSVGHSPTIGYWVRRSARTDLGLNFGVVLEERDDPGRTSASFAFSPALKRYTTPRGPLAPYTYLGLVTSFWRVEHGSNDTPSEYGAFGVGGEGGLGLEWLPAAGVSIGGHAGLSGTLRWETQEYPSPTGGRRETESQGFSLQTFNSGIRVHLYF